MKRRWRRARLARFPDLPCRWPLRILEVKRPGGRLSPDQQRIADHMKRAGHRFEVVYFVEAAISVLVVWGVARGMAVQRDLTMRLTSDLVRGSSRSLRSWWRWRRCDRKPFGSPCGWDATVGYQSTRVSREVVDFLVFF